MIFRNLVAFYLLIVLPLMGWIILVRDQRINQSLFVSGLAIYVFFYHPLISGLRLLSAYKITKSQFLLNFIPFWNLKYFKFLYFNK